MLLLASNFILYVFNCLSVIIPVFDSVLECDLSEQSIETTKLFKINTLLRMVRKGDVRDGRIAQTRGTGEGRVKALFVAV